MLPAIGSPIQLHLGRGEQQSAAVAVLQQHHCLPLCHEWLEHLFELATTALRSLGVSWMPNVRIIPRMRTAQLLVTMS